MLILQEFRDEKPGWRIRGSQALGSTPKPNNGEDCRGAHTFTFGGWVSIFRVAQITKVKGEGELWS